MSVDDYKKAYIDIICSQIIDKEQARQKYICLMNIFIQDCSLNIHQPYFGNLTKQKSRILFLLQEHFI